MARLGYSDQWQRAAIGQLAPDFDRRYNKHGGWFYRCAASEDYHRCISRQPGAEKKKEESFGLSEEELKKVSGGTGSRNIEIDSIVIQGGLRQG